MVPMYGATDYFVDYQVFIKTESGIQPEAVSDPVTLEGERIYLKERILDTGLENWYLFDLLDGEGRRMALSPVALDQVCQVLMARSGVEFAQPNFIYKRIIRREEGKEGPDLEGFYELWAFDNDGSELMGQNYYDRRQGVEGMDINILPAWELTRGSKDVVVVIADDGLDVSHVEFKGRVIQDPIYNPQFLLGKYDEFGDSFASHGTHVAGIIGASWSTGEITGVAPNTSLLPVNILSNPKVDDLNDQFATTDSAIATIYIAKENDGKIINNSWGSERWTLDVETGEKVILYDWAYDLLLREAISSVEDSILYVVAAGNDGHDTDIYPSVPDLFGSDRVGPDGEEYEALKNVISVTAIDNRGRLTDFSNYGLKTVDISAPGWGIYSTIPGDEYSWYDGTSMAAPMVSGVAALMYAVNPDLTPEEVIKIIVETGRLLPDEEDHGKTASDKILDAYQAVKMAKDQYEAASSKYSPWALKEGQAAEGLNLVVKDMFDDYQLEISRLEFSYLILDLYQVMTGQTVETLGENPFVDTDDQAVLKVYSLGIIKGKTETTFQPSANISRQEMATMFYRTLRVINDQYGLETYELASDDRDLVAGWAYEAMAFMNHHGLIQGIGNNLIDPLGSSSREVAIILVYRTYLTFGPQ